MPERSSLLLLEDMLDAIASIRNYTEGMSYVEFLADKKTQDAVLRNLHVLGEAAKRVSQAIKETHPEVEWQRIIRSRHILVHDYFSVDYEIVWRIVEVHLQPLHDALLKITEENI